MILIDYVGSLRGCPTSDVLVFVVHANEMSNSALPLIDSEIWRGKALEKFKYLDDVRTANE